MDQAIVGDLRAAEVQDRKIGQPLQMNQSVIGDLRIAKVEDGEIGQSPQMRRPSSETMHRRG